MNRGLFIKNIGIKNVNDKREKKQEKIKHSGKMFLYIYCSKI
jgi:hypothetical protein